MAQTIKIKRSATGGSIPSTTDLELGELAINTFDGILYAKKNDGTTDSIVTLSGGGSGGSYTAGPGIDITGNIISSDVRSAGDGTITVQLGDGMGGFVSIPPNAVNWVLTSNGSMPPTWEPVPVSGGTVKSIDIHSNVGLAFNGGPITDTGFFTVAGTLSVDNGGTGGTTPSDAMSNLLPAQTGNTGASLITDGNGNLSWYVVPGIAYVGGAGVEIDSNVINSTVADNLGNVNLVQISKGDGTLLNVAGSPAGRVLTSMGPTAVPQWLDPAAAGTVTDIILQANDQVGLHITGGDDYIPPVDGSKHITHTGTLGLGGILSLKNGGTGVNDDDFPQLIIDTALPSMAGKTGQFLTTNGTAASWSVPAGGGTVISVDVDGHDTGFHFAGGPITSSGVLTMSGKLAVGFGGTGADNPVDALNTFLPSQSSKVGQILTTDGTNAAWTTSSAGSVTSVDIDPQDTGFHITGGPITSSGILALSGVLKVSNGGTGGSDAEHAINNLLPVQTGNATRFLTTDGTDVRWDVPAGGGTVTSIQMSGGVTGITFTGGPITTNGTITLGGTLALLNGGTGGTSARIARNNILPAQSGNAGKILTSDGTDATWTTSSAGSVTSVDINGVTSGLTFTGGPITSSGTFTVGGILTLLNGGTGSSNAQGARNNILPDQGTHGGQFLQTDGTNCSWATVVAASGTVTSVDISGSSTGLTFTGGPITTTGTITLGGTLGVLNGGTGATNANGALANLLPSQSGNVGKVLSTTGTNTQWITVTASVAGADTQLQYNNSGAFGATANLTVNKSTGALTSAGSVTGISHVVTGAVNTVRPVQFQTGALNRWLLQANGSGESGSNAGSDFEFTGVNDDGTTTNQVFTVARATRILDFKVNPTINGVAIGYATLPRVTTFDINARGKRVAVSGGFTIPSGTYSAGDAFSFYNDSGSTITITQGSGLTLRFDGSATTGNRTLSARGSCFVWFNSASEAIINGSIA